MSFILDALKKSEAERRQGEVPSLSNDLGPTVARRRSVWPLLLTVALLLNVAVIGGWLLLRHEISPVAEAPSGELDRVLAAPSIPSTPGKEATPEPSPKKTSPAVAPEPTPSAVAVKPSPEPTAKPAPAASFQVESSSPDPVVQAPTISQAPVILTMETPVVSEVAEELDATDQPAESAQPQFVAERATAASAASVESFPRLADLSSDVRSGLPELNLQLHFYSPEPARRLVRLNGFNLREGDQGGEGLNVVEITPDGIRLSCQGVRFFLPTARR